MTLYDFTSGIITIIGLTVLAYRIVHELQSGKSKKLRIQRLCTKWLIFTIFVKFENYLVLIFDFIPLGKLALFVLKIFLFLPQNSMSHLIYKKIHRQLQRIKLQSYRSYLTVAISFLVTLTVSLLLKLTAKIAAFIDSDHIQEVERHILQIIKTLEYKKSAISMRHQNHLSDVNKDLNTSQFSNSLIEDDFKCNLGKKVRSSIGNKMNRIFTESQKNDCIKLRAEVMITKPNKSTGSKAKYKQGQLTYYPSTSQISFQIGHALIQVYTLLEIRWITKNMMNIQTVLKEGGSKIVRIKDISDVVRWIQPVCANLQKLQENDI